MTPEQDEWTCEYDADTGEHRIYEDGELIACVGNIDMEFNRQEELAEMIRSAPKTPSRPEQSALSKLEAGTHVLVPVGPTADSVDSVCLSFNHSFGLMSRPEKQRCRYVASMWLRAWVKEARYGTLKSVQEGE